MGEKVVVLAGDDPDGMSCPDHPFSNPGGICAFCLQEKLGKLVSSSSSPSTFFPVPPPSSSSSSSPPSNPPVPPKPNISFLKLGNKKHSDRVGLTRNNSVHPTHTPRRRWFWSRRTSWNAQERKPQEEKPKDKPREEEGSCSGSTPAAPELGRKVARSRSVGCGSRSFSGDFLERLSTGLGDCALRRVESQREPPPAKIVLHRSSTSAVNNEERSGQMRVRCGGIFGGFGMVSGSNGGLWLPEELSGERGPARRGKGWGWAFASPIRAFRRPEGVVVGRE